MRHLGMLLLGTGLIVSGLGCNCALQHTAGICDYDPPPVQSLLIGPNPGHSSLGVYGSIDHTPISANQSIPSRVEAMPSLLGPPPKAEVVPVMPKVVPMK